MIKFTRIGEIKASIIVNWNRGQKVPLLKVLVYFLLFFFKDFYNWHKSRFYITMRDHILDCFGLAFTKVSDKYNTKGGHK